MQAELVIYRSGTQFYTAVVTPQASREWKLMEKDCITLVFNEIYPIVFQIGDYIQTEYGKYYITEEPVPADYTGGAYKYTLQFDAEYIGWKNKILKLTYNLKRPGKIAEIVRGDANWSLTDTIEVHVREIFKNLLSLGYAADGPTPLLGYSIDGKSVVYVDATMSWKKVPIIPTRYFTGVKDTKLMQLISYDGIDIIQGLNSISETFECEWWVTKALGLFGGIPVICFGKCEYGSYLDFRIAPEASDYADLHDVDATDVHDADNLDVHTNDLVGSGENGVINVDRMSIARNENVYANRLYVYGSTKNIPYSYRKDLLFTCTDKKLSNGHYIIWDSTKKLYPRMVKGACADQYGDLYFSKGMGIHDGKIVSSELYTTRTEGVAVISNAKNAEGVSLIMNGAYVTINVYLGISGDYTKVWSEISINSVDEEQVRKITFANLPNVSEELLESFDSIAIEQSYYKEGLECSYYLDGSDSTVKIKTASGGTYTLPYIREEYDQPGAILLNEISLHNIIKVGEEFEIDDSSLEITEIPFSYYTTQFGDINSVTMIGEQRLMLPEEIPYIDSKSGLTTGQIVEKVVIFDNVFPSCALRVVAVKEYRGNIVTETYADGSERIEETANYFIALRRVTPTGDVDFPFREAMRIDGTELQIKFLTQEEEKAYTEDAAKGDITSGYQLSGLTFNVGVVSFNADMDIDGKRDVRYSGFQIARNNDYGAMFPNLSRKPTIGDTLVLSGWNVKAMQLLGLFDSAEEKLLAVGNDYAGALEDNQFSFDCTMMSDWMQPRIENNWMGQRVRIHHGSLDSAKESRVIGYQFKLDIPYDSAVLSVGETEAYSRIKAIEKKYGISVK